MKLEIQKAKINGPKNTYVIQMDTYFGDADGDATHKVKVAPEKIQQVIAEALIVQEQFPNGRGGCSRKYDQTNYFSLPDTIYESLDEKHDGYFEWLDRDFGDYPYSGDYEQNYSLRSFDVYWYDADGQKFKVRYTEYENLLKELAELNKKHKLADYDAWNEVSYPSYHSPKSAMAVYEEAQAKLEEQFSAYRADVIEMIKRHTDSSVD